MSFLLPLALLLGLTALAPILAHALRKGQSRPLPFPAARLVPSRTSSAKERNRLDDRFLLLLRILLLFCLALLAASPFAQCSRLALARTDGASVFATLVIDDSASMRARDSDGTTRLDAAIKGAQQLLSTSQPGDSFAIVLAGHPARVLTPPTADLGSIELALDTIQPSDRRTDLDSALSIARSLGSNLPHGQRPLVLLSDLAEEEDSRLNLDGVLVPSDELRKPFSNCAVIEAAPAGHAVVVEVSCTDENSILGRKLELVDQTGVSLAPPMNARDGSTQIDLPEAPQNDESPFAVDQAVVRLTAPKDASLDQIPEDDSSPVLGATARLSVGLRADSEKAGMKTGAGTVLGAAIEALKRDLRIQELSVLPDRADELQMLSALLIDDPSGFTPEAREALTTWVELGGVAVLFAGPAIDHSPLGSEFSPFLIGAPSWSANPSPGVDPKAPGSLGPLSTSWSDLNARHRVLLPHDEGLQVRARWEDDEPLVVERLTGRGTFITVGLPSSVDESDLALRPAFIELLDHVVTQAALRTGALATPVGQHWALSEGQRVEGPDGEILNILSDSTAKVGAEYPGRSPRYVEASVAGRYRILGSKGESKPSFRFAMRDLREHVRQPNPGFVSHEATKREATLAKVDISRQIALLTLVLGVLELAFRGFRRFRAATPFTAQPTSP